MLTYGSLFTGIGGIDLGFDRAGMQCKWQCEIDEYATKVLEKHWPKVTRYKDIRDVGSHNLEWVDVICGGFPCQDISVAGKGAGLDGERSGLFFEAIRVVRQIKPRFVVLENVAALLIRGLGRVLWTLAEIGYDAEWHCIPAAAVGAPHIRDRIFVIAFLSDAIWTERESGTGRGRVRQGDSVLADATNMGSSVDQCIRSNSTEKFQTTKRSSRKRREKDVGNADFSSANAYPSSSGSWSSIGKSSWWAVEPELGGTINGFSEWLDGNLGFIIESHKRMMANVICRNGDCNASRTKERTEEVMSMLRNVFGEKDVWQSAGGLVRIYSQEVLFSYLCKHSKQTANEAWLQLSSEEAFEENMRSVRTRQELAGSSCRPGHNEQFTIEHPDIVQALSRLLAHDSRSAWMEYCGNNATAILNEWGSGWEHGVMRVANGISNRVDRLKCLGNAVVPQVAEWVGRRVIEISNSF